MPSCFVLHPCWLFYPPRPEVTGCLSPASSLHTRQHPRAAGAEEGRGKGQHQEHPEHPPEPWAAPALPHLCPISLPQLSPIPAPSLPHLSPSLPLSPGVWLSTPTRRTARTSWSCRREKGSVFSARSRTGGCGGCPCSPAGSGSSPATTWLPSSGLGFLPWDKKAEREGGPGAGVPPAGRTRESLTLLSPQEIQPVRFQDAFPVHLLDAVHRLAVLPGERVRGGPEAEPGPAAAAAARARPCPGESPGSRPCPRESPRTGPCPGQSPGTGTGTRPGTRPAAPRPRQRQEE